MNCQKGDDPITEGNRLADKAAPTAAQQAPPKEKTVLVAPALTLEDHPPPCTPEVDQWAKSEGAARLKGHWWKLPTGQIFVPVLLGLSLVDEYHQFTHLGKTALEALRKKQYHISQLSAFRNKISGRSLACAKNNPQTAPRAPSGVQRTGTSPF